MCWHKIKYIKGACYKILNSVREMIDTCLQSDNVTMPIVSLITSDGHVRTLVIINEDGEWM